MPQLEFPDVGEPQRDLCCPFPPPTAFSQEQKGEDQQLPTKARILFLSMGKGEQAPSAVSFKE